MGLTQEQHDIVYSQTPGLMTVEAYAGSGKTYTLKQFALARPKDKIVYLVFNKTMADEAREKLSSLPNVEVRTIHSLAYRHVGWKYKKRLGDIRPSDILPHAQLTRPSHLFSVAALVCSWLSAFMSSADQTIEEFFYHRRHLLADANPKLQFDHVMFGKVLKSLWDKILQDESFPMPHSAYLKLFQLSAKPFGYDYILVDEAQDVTDAMIDFVLRQQGARKVLIGDSYQQIYSWNGAVNSLAKLRSLAVTKYLTQSFRCPDDIAMAANQYLKVMGADKPFKGTKEPPQDSSRAFLSRTNAELFNFGAENCLQLNIHYLGGFENYDFQSLLDIAHLRFQEHDKIRDPIIRQFGTIDELTDYAESADPQIKARLGLVKKYGKRVFPLYFEMRDRAVSQERCDITVSTGHKAKGQEWTHVQLAGDFVSLKTIVEELEMEEKKPASQRQAKAERVSKEELNLLYVSITRSKGELVCPEDYILYDQDLARLKIAMRDGKLIIEEPRSLSSREGDVPPSNSKGGAPKQPI